MGAARLLEMARQQNGRADAVEYIRWRGKHGLSLTDAAEALGLSRRQVAYYASGEHAVPRTVLLACKGWEVERQAAAQGGLRARQLASAQSRAPNRVFSRLGSEVCRNAVFSVVSYLPLVRCPKE